MEISAAQMARMKRIYVDLDELLRELGVIENTPEKPADPQWLRDTAKQWGLLNAVAEHHGDVGSEEWSRLGRQHGYDPRGLGGYFQGSQPLMAKQGVRRVLTEHGKRFIERWRADFAPAP